MTHLNSLWSPLTFTLLVHKVYIDIFCFVPVVPYSGVSFWPNHQNVVITTIALFTPQPYARYLVLAGEACFRQGVRAEVARPHLPAGQLNQAEACTKIRQLN